MRMAAQDDPLFSSTWSALVFAFNYSSQQYQPSPLARLMRGPIGRGKGLAGLDGAGQAGMIKQEVGKLPVDEYCAIVARFAVGIERRAAMRHLMNPAIACLGTSRYTTRMVDILVQRFYGRHVRLHVLADQCRMHPNSVGRRWARIRSTLLDIERRALDHVDDALRDAGLVP